MSIYEVMIIVACVALTIVRLLPRRWIALLLPPSGDGRSVGDECVACGSRNVRLLGPMVYRCNACGHEGGDGWATYERARRDATFEAWSPAKRRKSARRDLMEARTLILAGLGDLQRAGSHAGSEPSTPQLRTSGLPEWLSVGSQDARVRITGLPETDREEHEQAKASGVGRLLEAQAKARDAQAKLGTSLGDVVDASLDVNGELLAEGTALLVAVEAELRALRRGARASARAPRRAPPP